MSIVTISHAPYSGGSEIAEKIASVLNYRCVDREVLIEASRRYGIPEAKYAEILEAEGHWWERWMESLRLYRITLQAAMCEVAQEGPLIYYGRAGQELFPGISHVLKVLIVAPMEYRMQEVKSQKGLDGDNAKHFLLRSLCTSNSLLCLWKQYKPRLFRLPNLLELPMISYLSFIEI